MLISQVKSSNRKWSTMIELLVMMAIMALGISTMLGVIGSWMDFAKSTEDTIKAINLAREWLEWVTNWRDTNWLRFSSDKTNCWKVQNVPSYSSSCIGDNFMSDSNSNTDTRNIQSWSYLLYTNNWVWFLSWISTNPDWVADWSSYTQLYKTWLDANGFFTQTGGTSSTYCSSVWQTNCLTIFTREIQISLPVNTDPSYTWTIYVASIVRWKWKGQHEVRLNTTLTNWKSKF